MQPTLKHLRQKRAERRQADVRGTVGGPRYIHKVIDAASSWRDLVPKLKRSRVNRQGATGAKWYGASIAGSDLS